MIDQIELKYSVGALLYTPANNTKLGQYIIEEKFGKGYSLAMCLEDTISDNKVKEAEEQLVRTIKIIYETKKKNNFFCPKIFVRVRNPKQIITLYEDLGSASEYLVGYILPKYSLGNAESYNKAIKKVNTISDKIIYMMPILESRDILNLLTRSKILYEIKEYIDSIKEYVLNVRVGGNDFSNQFAVRRHINETIYDNISIAQILSDIITVFSGEYVVSGPVWEYFDSVDDEWKDGLSLELKLDQLNGFIGKTVIHPKQIEVVNEGLKVFRDDYNDALKILKWNKDDIQVGKSIEGQRMNEVKTHYNWACKIITLAQIYGIR